MKTDEEVTLELDLNDAMRHFGDGGATMLDIRSALFLLNEIRTSQAMLNLLYARKITTSAFDADGEPIFSKVHDEQ